MPALPPVPLTIKARYVFDLGTNANVNVHMYWGYTGGPPVAADLNSLAATAYASAVTHLVPLLQNSQAFTGIELTDLNTSSGAVGGHNASTSGSRTGHQLPANVATLVNLIISRRYRGGKPRWYWPFGTAEDLNTPEQWGSTFTTAAQGGLQLHIDDLIVMSAGTTSVTKLVNVSYYQGFTAVTNPITGRTKDVAKLRTGGPVVDNLNSFAVNAKVGSQRRRVGFRV